MGFYMKKILVILIVIFPIVCWAVFKPIRVIAPELNGLECFSNHICTDNKGFLQEAEGLLDHANKYVYKNISSIRKPPKVIFCTTLECE